MDDYQDLYKHVVRLDDGLSETPAKPLSNDELIRLIDEAIAHYKGDVTELENAIGALMLGRKIGWRAAFVLHSPKSIRLYERCLGVKFQDILPEGGPKRHKLNAWIIAHKVSNFWKLVKGELPGIRTPSWRHTDDGVTKNPMGY